MGPTVHYVLGGPAQPEIEAAKLAGTQPMSDFNVFVERNAATLVTTSEVAGGSPTSMRRRITLANHVASHCGPNDTVVASGEDIGFPLALAMLARRARASLWIVIHGSYLGTSKLAAIAPILRRSNRLHLLCLSGSLQRQMVETYGFPAAKCFNAGYGVDTDFFRPAPHADRPLVLSAGSSNRDYRTLVQAMADLDAPVRIAADSLWRPKEVSLEGLRLPASIEVASAGNYANLRSLYARASIVAVPLHPARYASGYAVIVEAMATGRVVVTTRTEGLSDFIVEGETGLYVEPGDAAGLRAAIAGLLENPARARAMGEAAAARMRNDSLQAYSGRIERLIAGQREEGQGSAPRIPLTEKV